MSTSTVAELSSIADSVGRYRERVADLAQPYIGSAREDVLSAVYEAERQLRSAERAIQRALKTLGH